MGSAVVRGLVALELGVAIGFLAIGLSRGPEETLVRGLLR